jgi:hypothetical protein
MMVDEPPTQSTNETATPPTTPGGIPKPLPSDGNDSNCDPRAPRRDSDPPNWADKGTLAILVLTFGAAYYAGHEADRLATDTETALSDARTVASQTHTDNVAALAKTDEAVKAANRSADSASKNIDVLIGSERARLFIGKVTLNKASENDPAPKIDYTWVNLGRGPAIVNDMLLTCQIVDKAIPTIPFDDATKLRHGQFAIGGGASAGTTDASVPLPTCLVGGQLTPADWVAINADQKSILFSGFLRYQDAFHKYKWHFGLLYVGEGKFFSNGPIPTYNWEIQEDRAK